MTREASEHWYECLNNCQSGLPRHSNTQECDYGRPHTLRHLYQRHPGAHIQKTSGLNSVNHTNQFCCVHAVVWPPSSDISVAVHK